MTSLLICSKIIYHVLRCFDTPQPRAAAASLMSPSRKDQTAIPPTRREWRKSIPKGRCVVYLEVTSGGAPLLTPEKEHEKRIARSRRENSSADHGDTLNFHKQFRTRQSGDSNQRTRREVVAEDLLPQLGEAIA